MTNSGPVNHHYVLAFQLLGVEFFICWVGGTNFEQVADMMTAVGGMINIFYKDLMKLLSYRSGLMQFLKV